MQVAIENREITKRARVILSGNWAPAIGAAVLYAFILIALSLIPVVGSFIQFFISGALVVGLCTYYLNLTWGRERSTSMIFDGFGNYGNILITHLVTSIFILLWTLLLIIPGIIAQYSYSQVFYILANDPTVKPMDAIAKSKEMMQGNKFKLFCLQCRFIGWSILCVFTLGIGYFWLIPYMVTAQTVFYNELCGNEVA